MSRKASDGAGATSAAGVLRFADSSAIGENEIAKVWLPVTRFASSVSLVTTPRHVGVA